MDTQLGRRLTVGLDSSSGHCGLSTELGQTDQTEVLGSDSDLPHVSSWRQRGAEVSRRRAWRSCCLLRCFLAPFSLRLCLSFCFVFLCTEILLVVKAGLAWAPVRIGSSCVRRFPQRARAPRKRAARSLRKCAGNGLAPTCAHVCKHGRCVQAAYTPHVHTVHTCSTQRPCAHTQHTCVLVQTHTHGCTHARGHAGR